MPAASTGGTEDRASQVDARSSGAAAGDTNLRPLRRGEVRVMADSQGVFMFSMITGTITDRATEVTYENGQLTYTFETGRVWTAPQGWRSGDVFPMSSFGNYVSQCSCDLCRAAMRVPADRYREYDQLRAYGYIDRDPQAREELERRTNEQRARREAERAAREERMVAAKLRAEETLRMVLLPDELEAYDRTGQLIVTGADKRRYLISEGIVGNVALLSDEPDTFGRSHNIVAELCCHPDMYPDRNAAGEQLPYRDAHIAQVLYLRHDLEKFWDTANIKWHDLKARDEYVNRQYHQRRDRMFARIQDRLTVTPQWWDPR